MPLSLGLRVDPIGPANYLAEGPPLRKAGMPQGNRDNLPLKRFSFPTLLLMQSLTDMQVHKPASSPELLRKSSAFPSLLSVLSMLSSTQSNPLTFPFLTFMLV